MNGLHRASVDESFYRTYPEIRRQSKLYFEWAPPTNPAFGFLCLPVILRDRGGPPPLLPHIQHAPRTFLHERVGLFLSCVLSSEQRQRSAHSKLSFPVHSLMMVFSISSFSPPLSWSVCGSCSPFCLLYFVMHILFGFSIADVMQLLGNTKAYWRCNILHTKRSQFASQPRKVRLH